MAISGDPGSADDDRTSAPDDSVVSIPAGDLRRAINRLRRLDRRITTRIGAGSREIREVLETLFRHTPTTDDETGDECLDLLA